MMRGKIKAQNGLNFRPIRWTILGHKKFKGREEN